MASSEVSAIHRRLQAGSSLSRERRFKAGVLGVLTQRSECDAVEGDDVNAATSRPRGGRASCRRTDAT